MIRLKRFPNDSFSWKYKNCEYPRMLQKEAVAFGFWSYKLEKKEILYCMKHLDSVHCIAIFDEHTKIMTDITIDNLIKMR